MRGTWIYSTPILRIYDWLVPKVLNRFIWKCDTQLLVEQYTTQVGKRHIDLGPGTGYFLRRFADQKPHRFESLLLVDESQASLDHATKVLGDLGPRRMKLDLTNRESVMQLSSERANSVSASYLIHCLPRGLRDSEAMLEVISHVIGSNGVLFGSVILPDLARCRIRSRICCWMLNLPGVFGNKSDSLAELKSQLARHFSNCEVRVVQCVALFSVNNRIDDARNR